MDYTDYVWERGALRQKALRCTVAKNYRRYYLSIDDQVRALAAKRLQVLEAFAPRGLLLDFGEGTGRFRQAAAARGWTAFGRDIGRPAPAIRWDVVTFFDALEHLARPAETIQALAPSWLMVSVPWCHHPEDPDWFMPWKHRKPGEHLWHFSAPGLDEFMRWVGYAPVMRSCFEDDFRPGEGPLPNIQSAIFRRA